MAKYPKNGGDDEKRRALIRTVCYIIAAVSAAALAVCVAVYIAYRNDVMFIPIAIAAVFAMISFTYSRIK